MENLSEREKIEQKQKNHFDHIAGEYEANYDDEYSSKYRNLFINKPMLDSLGLKDKIVLEALCGSGQTTEYLLSRGAQVIGLDISEKLVESFKKRWPSAQVVQKSIFDTHFESNSFDVVVIVGGLHHLHPCVPEAMNEIYRVLKTGGYFCFAEPYSSSFVNLVRKMWYKHDPLFERNEGPIDLDMLMKKYSLKFNYVETKYIGSIAFLLVLNSMIFRIPTKLKKYYSDLVMNIEKHFSRIHTKKTACLSLNTWQKI